MTFVVLGPAATKGSTVSFIGKGGIVTKADCKGLAAWSQAVGWAARAARMPYASAGGAVKVRAIFQFVQPKSQRKRRHPTVKPDLDKSSRALLDALTGICYRDDAQVIELHVSKVYGPDARTVVEVEEIA